jgi:type III restriction enzyme
VNHRGDYGRWAFVELTDVWEIEREFASKVERALQQALAAKG